jgi:hypothetical protein
VSVGFFDILFFTQALNVAPNPIGWEKLVAPIAASAAGVLSMGILAADFLFMHVSLKLVRQISITFLNSVAFFNRKHVENFTSPPRFSTADLR